MLVLYVFALVLFSSSSTADKVLTTSPVILAEKLRVLKQSNNSLEGCFFFFSSDVFSCSTFRSYQTQTEPAFYEMKIWTDTKSKETNPLAAFVGFFKYSFIVTIPSRRKRYVVLNLLPQLKYRTSNFKEVVN